MASPGGYEPGYGQGMQMERAGGGGGSGSSMTAVAQLFARLSQEIEENKPKNCIHFIVGFLCKHYPEHLHGFASIWQMDPDLERERHEVVNFFKAHKISTAVAAHFTNAGYDTLDTLTTLSPDSLVDVEAFNNVKWLPGHKVRLQQIFSEISARVRAYRQQYGNPTALRPKAGNAAASGVGQSPNYAPPSLTGGLGGAGLGGVGGMGGMPMQGGHYAGGQGGYGPQMVGGPAAGALAPHVVPALPAGAAGGAYYNPNQFVM